MKLPSRRSDPVEALLRRIPPDPVSRPPVGKWINADGYRVLGCEYPAWARLMREVPSCSLGNGLLRLVLPHGDPDFKNWNADDGWRRDWPGESLVCVAYDWLGRLYGIEPTDCDQSVVRLLPGSGDIEETDFGLEEFLFEELVSHGPELLSAEYYVDWMRNGGRPLDPSEVAGYKVPLFLGGVDDTPNLDVTELTVYLSLMGQLFSGANALPEGTRIGSTAIQK
jgi:hypothetical protein